MMWLSFDRFARPIGFLAAALMICGIAACSARPGQKNVSLAPSGATETSDKLVETDAETLRRFKFSPDRLYIVSPADAVPGVPFFCSVGTGVDFEIWCPAWRRPYSARADTWLSNPGSLFEDKDPNFVMMSANGRQYRILSVEEPQEGHWFLAGLSRNQAATSFSVTKSREFVLAYKGGGPGDIVFVALRKNDEQSSDRSVVVGPLEDPAERNEIMSAIMTALGAKTPEQQAQFSPVFTEVTKVRCKSGRLTRTRCTLL